MQFSRRQILKTTIASAVAANSLTWFSAKDVFSADTVTIPSASHWGPFNAVVKDGDTKPHLRGKEPFVRVSWEEALAITANAIVTGKP